MFTDTRIAEDHPQLSTVLNTNPNVQWSQQPMFFGEKMGLARSDQIRYRIFHRLTEEQYSNYWRPHDINLEQDRADFATLPDNAKHIFLSNLAYQSLLDSEQSRATIFAFLPWVSNPELEACIKVWGFFEEIHNKAYEYILKNLFVDPTPFIDGILRNEAIMKRAHSITRYYDEFIRYGDRVKVFGYSKDLPLREHKRLAYRAMVSVYALEALRFFVSFSNTFAIAQQFDKMLGNAKQMKLIARDETLHVGISLNILRLWPKEDPEFAAIAEDEKQTVYDIFTEAVDGEKVWAEHLLERGAMLGMNVPLMHQSLESRANQRLKALGLSQIFAAKGDPFARWMSNWMATADEQVAPQETEIDAYKVSNLNRDVDESELIVDF